MGFSGVVLDVGYGVQMRVVRDNVGTERWTCGVTDLIALLINRNSHGCGLNRV